MKWIGILFMVSTPLFAQNIEPVKGFGNIHVEMSTADLEAILGKPNKIVTYAEEKKVWDDGDYNTDRSIAFIHGFDFVYVYEEDNEFCLWKAYFKDDHAIYMNISSVYVPDRFTEDITVKGKLHFQDPIEKFDQVLGFNYYVDKSWSYTDHLYHDLGLRFTFKQGRMTNIYLYRPFDNRADLMRMLRFYRSELE